jgi:hypothetical protein
MSSKSLTTALIASIFVAGMAGSALAQTTWQQDHPRREQVNGRLDNQNQLIYQDYKNGQITKGQAQQLYREDRRIRQEERSMAARNGGHITRNDRIC